MMSWPTSAVLLSLVGLATAQGPTVVGLTAGPEGTVLKDGKPFRGIGVNYIEPFLRLLDDPTDMSCEQGFATLHRYSIPFVRMVGSGWGGAGMALYRTDPAEYFRRLDRVIAAAERHQVGIIFSMFWTHWPLELAGERGLHLWNTPGTASHTLMCRYIQEVVERYRSSPAIWVWEFGNELNLSVDLPNAAEFGIQPEDRFTHAEMRKLLVEFATQVRRHDPTRLIDSGGTAPRASAWHQMTELSWTPDSPEDWCRMLMDDTPDPLNLVSVHSYGEDDLALMPLIAVTAKRMGKPLLIGEFGVPGPRDESSERLFRAQLAAIEENGVALAAAWEFDTRIRSEWNIVEGGDRGYMLEAIREANQRLAAP